MELKQMEYFRVLCEKKNITKAAETLYLSRQSLSVSMKKLEEELGVVLLRRKKEGIELTEAGQVFYEYVCAQEKLAAACYKKLEVIKANTREVIRVGMRTIAFDPQAFGRMLDIEKTLSGVSIEIVDEGCPDYFEALSRAEIDIAYITRPPEESGLLGVPLTTDEHMVVAEKNSRLAQLDTVDFARDLVGETLLVCDGMQYKAYKQQLEPLGISVRMVVGDINLLRAMMARKKGCCVTFSSLAERYADDKLCCRPVVNSLIDANAYLVYRPGISQNARRLIRSILSQYGFCSANRLPDE